MIDHVYQDHTDKNPEDQSAIVILTAALRMITPSALYTFTHLPDFTDASTASSTR